LNRWVDFHEIWYSCSAIQGDFEAVIFNPISSNILKLLRFKVVSWRHDFKPCSTVVWDCLIVGLLGLHYIQSLANVTMATIACNILKGKNDIKAGMLPWQPGLLVVYCRAEPS
jgi:hypothetical protein